MNGSSVDSTVLSEKVQVDSMAPETAQRLAALLDWERPPAAGDVLPPLWHWAYFPELAPQAALGDDGHPRPPGDLATRFSNRMAASGRVRWLAPCRLGQSAERHSQLADLTEKSGRSGPLVFANWRRAVRQGGHTVIEERQTVVYRPAQATPSGTRRAAPSSAEVASDGKLRRTLAFDPVLLFRFSAVTWNAHRIHYDRPYATGAGYPGLVVHGPLLAMLLARDALDELGGLSDVEFRAHTPVFDGEVVEVYLASSKGSCALEARHRDGTVAASLTAHAQPSEPAGGLPTGR